MIILLLWNWKNMLCYVLADGLNDLLDAEKCKAGDPDDQS